MNNVLKKIYLTSILASLVLPLSAQASSHQTTLKPHANQAMSAKTMASASPQQDSGYWLIQAGLGGGRYSSGTDGETFAVTRIETDSLAESSKPTHLFYMLNLQRVTPVHHGLISAIGVGPTIYYQPGSFSGQVYQFQVPTLNNYNYRYKVKPLNLYAEADIYFKSFFAQRISPYLFIGGGASFVHLRYGETVTPAAAQLWVPANSALPYTSGDDQLLSYELGAGVKIRLAEHYFIAARYVYQHSGHADLYVPGALSPLRVDLNSNSGYVTVGYRFS